MTTATSIDKTKLPSPIPVTQTRFRAPKKNIPQTKPERDELLSKIRAYNERVAPVAPMPLDEIEVHARKILEETGTPELYLHYTAVLLNNEMWRETLATIPYERRLLLMPKCLRVEDKCPAPFDEFGLLCKQCGLCTIEDFQNEAERLGYAVLVAEGSAVVMSLIQTGKIEAIVGISCLPVLERTFPYVEAAAIPSVAVPLLQDDCIDTTVDIDWVWDVIHLTSEDKTRRLNLNDLQQDVRDWFTLDELENVMGAADGVAERIGRDWLSRDGKRWRPFLTVAAFQALRKDRDEPVPEDLRKIAVAVECFHKASLIHDDIQDEDSVRYGRPTMHEDHGVAVAINVGDLLIGEGYRLIAECEAPEAAKAQMLKVAANGQRQLCRGQGEELNWAMNPKPLNHKQVLQIHRFKTAPAFEVALKLGAAYSGSLSEVDEVIETYSENLGVAYQIRDDMDDLSDDALTDTAVSFRPNVLLALAREKSSADDRTLMEAMWNSELHPGSNDFRKIREIAHRSGADERCLTLLEMYKEAAIRSLVEVENENLKGLLRRVLGKIFNELEIKGWCSEYEVKNGVREENAPVDVVSA
ncbi:MAG: polyprenyl synthetase family protein [Verrucomicrobiales bacterium]